MLYRPCAGVPQSQIASDSIFNKLNQIDAFRSASGSGAGSANQPLNYASKLAFHN